MNSDETAGIFISFEGGDGVGKSTQSRLLGEWLKEVTGHAVLWTREPGGTDLGLVLREAVLHGDHMDPRTEALLYAADRAHHVATVVRPALERGDVVITDRYLDSSVAYQAGGRALAAQEVEDLSLWAVEGLLPRMTILLDLDPTVGATRLTQAPDRLERAGDAFHRRTREAFLDRAAHDPVRWLVVDASGTAEEIHHTIRSAVAKTLDLDLDLEAQESPRVGSAAATEASGPAVALDRQVG